MKLLKHLTLLCMLVALAAGCTKQAPPSLDLLTTSISLPCEGGTAEVSIKTNQNWTVSASQPWLTVMPGGGSASADYQTLTITATANEGEEKRQAEVTVTTGELSRMVSVSQAGTPRFTIRDFLAKPANTTTWYRLTGEVASLPEEHYGNFYLIDDTGLVYVYGLCEKRVNSNDQSFSKLGLKPGDTVTMMTLRSEHNKVAEAGGTTPAYFVSKVSGQYKLGSKVKSTSAKWMELPATSATDGQDQLIHRFADGKRSYSAYWDYKNLVSSWVAYPLHAGNIGDGSRSVESSFPMDPLLTQAEQPYLSAGYRAGNASGTFDRGHQIASADRPRLRPNFETFFGTNITPQDNGLNSGPWGSLEIKVRNWAKNAATDTLYVVTGCYGADAAAKYVEDSNGKHVGVPAGYYKALLRLSKDKTYSALGIWYDNKFSEDTNFKGLSMSIDALEKKVGVDFFVNLPDDVEKTVEAADPKAENWWWNN